MKNLLNKVIVIGVLGLSLIGCKKALSPEEQAQRDEEIIVAYIDKWGLDAVATGTGLYYVIETEGGGIHPTATSDVRVQYKGYFTDSDVFDESNSVGITFNLQNVIAGWTEGIPYFKEGGSGKLLIPSALGYGTSGSGSIPPNTVLIFDVTLHDVL